ncbi:MAG: serine/threonine protein kinase [Candidatus Aureabacteria bacterium]|nr:serine/threonine protein kinase [Candidatus Auribacterota bacterium]
MSNLDIEKLLAQMNPPLKLINQIAIGGQKCVYKARKVDSSDVVFKVLKQNSNNISRLQREIRAVSLIKDANVPLIIDTNVDNITDENELIWVIEEYVEGTPLRKLLSQNKLFSVSEVVQFLDTMFRILHKSENMQIVHRDIKPENIMVDQMNQFWLIDFGISRHLDLTSITPTDSPFGPFTVGYAASEQFRNSKKNIDIRTDLFSLGVVCAEMIIGHNPFIQNTDDVLQVIKKIEQQPLPLYKISGDNQFLLARFIKTLGDNRISRRPRNITEAIQLFEIIKKTLTL